MADFELHFHAVRCSPEGSREVAEAQQADGAAVGSSRSVALGDVEDVLVDVLFHHEPRASAEVETFALADGVEPVAAVGAEGAACFELDDFPFALAEVAADEVVVVDFAEEADALRVLARGRGETRLGGDGAHLGFQQAADREAEAADLVVVELREEVGLVFDGVGCGG